MKQIHSKDNPTFKQLVRIVQGKKTANTPYIWLEGLNLSRAWLDADYAVHQAVFAIEDLEANRGNITELAARIAPQKCVGLTAPLMRQLSQVEQGQGMGLVVLAPQYELPETITQSCVYLDRVQDPGNVGTLLRTLAAAGIKQAYLSPACASAWSQKVLRSAQGAHFVLRIHENVSYESFLSKLQIPLYVTALEQAQSLFKTSLPQQMAWVFGNEGQGVAQELLAAADERVFIPQELSVESLNVAAAAAICLFEQRRQHLFPEIE